MMNQILTHNVTPFAPITSATKKADPSFGGKSVAWTGLSAIKTSADLRLCHYRMAKCQIAGSGLERELTL